MFMGVLSTEDAIKLAVWLDSTGMITIRREKTGYYRPEVALTTTTNLNLARKLQKIAGAGRIKKRAHSRSNPKHKDQQLLMLSQEEVRELLPQMQPYLMMKATQARLLMETLEIRESLWGNGYIKDDPFVIAQRRALHYRWKRVRELNAQGRRGRDIPAEEIESSDPNPGSDEGTNPDDGGDNDE